jgi:hypothetical protein
MGRIGLLVAATLMILVGLLALPGVSQAANGSSCNHDPCTNLPYSFTVTVDGMVVPNMDDNLFGGYHQGDVGLPLISTNQETYVSNPDGSITGTVTAGVTVGLTVSEPLANDVVVYLDSTLPQNGYMCSGSGCVYADNPCVLPAGQTTTSCIFSDWWQAYSSSLPIGTGTFDIVIYSDPGQPNLVTDDGHSNAYGEGLPTSRRSSRPFPHNSFLLFRRSPLPVTPSWSATAQPSLGTSR